uniref:Carboxylesterase type B domain-containing protein n=1 Tax=Ditylenchus dipsaci TaxID=166011 RepID=A0A915CQG1_9BILA
MNRGFVVLRFDSIPYAQPPVGKLRLERPRPFVKWPEGVIEAKSYGFASIPLTYLPNSNSTNKKPVRVNEDCLTLNVFRPTKQCDHTSGYPVLVYIHGGEDNLILVTIQYRLGPLGLLSDGTDDFAGNYGLWDQAMALQFLYENINAGAASITELSLSPYCKESIFSTIEMSGTALAGWAANDRVVQVTHQLVEQFKKSFPNGTASAHYGHCDTSKQVLQSKTVAEIQDAVHKLDTGCYEVNLLKYQPRIDGQFIPKDFGHLLKESPAKPCLMGITANEALYFTILGKDRVFNRLYIEKEDFHNFDKSKLLKIIEDLIAPTHKFQCKQEAKIAQTDIAEFYLGKSDPLNGCTQHWIYHLERYTQMLSDILFNVSIMWMARQRAKCGWPTYIYYNEYFNPDQYPDWVPFKASTHANEYPYMHGLFPVGKFKFNTTDYLHQRILLQMISSFAIHGSPSLDRLEGDWPTVPSDESKPIIFLKIDSNSKLQSGSMPELERTAHFWLSFAAKYSYDPVRDIQKSPIVITQTGKLQGFTDFATDSEKIGIFLGIPFAQPPVEELRFEKPVAAHKWKGIRAADKLAPACVPHARPSSDWMQKGFSEDCLYLNVFTPHRPPTAPPPSKLLPVLVIIHGGGYVQGSALRYSNYKELGRKLGVAGFASSGDLTFPVTMVVGPVDGHSLSTRQYPPVWGRS